jgi:hypothetical protein
MPKPATPSSTLTAITRVFLVATSIAPMGAIYALTIWTKGPRTVAPWLIGVASLVLCCLGIMRHARKEIEQEQVVLTKVTNLDKDVLAFLIAYGLPLITPIDKPMSAPALCGFAMIMMIVLYQLQFVYVNPLLGMFGYHFLDVESQKGQIAILITRTPPGLVDQNNTSMIAVAKLSPRLWLEKT